MENSAVPDFLTGKEEIGDNILSELQGKVDHLLKVEAEIKDAEDALKILKKEQLRFSGEEIPTLLSQYGLSEIKLDTGQKIIVKEDLSVTVKDSFLYHKFLRKRSHDDIIKTVFEFGKLEHDDYEKVANAIDGTGIDYNASDKVHAQTTKKYFKELIGMGDSVPEMTLGDLPKWVSAFVFKKTKIK